MILSENPIGTHVWIDGVEYVTTREVHHKSCDNCDLQILTCSLKDREPCWCGHRTDGTGIIFKRCCNVAKLHP